MKKIFIESKINKADSEIYIKYEENTNIFHHLTRVLRVKKGESFKVGDLSENEFQGKIIEIDKSKITVSILGKTTIKNTLPDISIFFSVLKGNHNETIIRQCSELGITSFHPVITSNSIIKSPNDIRKKVSRWEKISLEAAMQSGAKKKPKIFDIILFDEIKNYDIKYIKYFAHIDEQSTTLQKALKKNNLNNSHILFFIGPEGDFSSDEISILKKSNWEAVNISPNILRSETACVFAASVMTSFFWEL